MVFGAHFWLGHELNGKKRSPHEVTSFGNGSFGFGRHGL